MSNEIPVDIHVDAYHDDNDESDTIMVSAGVIDQRGTNWNATGHVYPPVTDDELAGMLLRAAEGAAAIQGTGVWMALQRRLNLEVQ